MLTPTEFAVTSLVATGDTNREVADKLARVASRIHSAEYIAYGPGQRWDVSMQRVSTGTGDVIVCAIGGSAAERRQRIGRTAAAAQRILAA